MNFIYPLIYRFHETTEEYVYIHRLYIHRLQLPYTYNYSHQIAIIKWLIECVYIFI